MKSQNEIKGLLDNGRRVLKEKEKYVPVISEETGVTEGSISSSCLGSFLCCICNGGFLSCFESKQRN